MDILYALLYMLNEMSPYILLGFLIAGLLHAFVPTRSLTRHLSGTGLNSVVKAALFGIPLPLCSCGVLPTAIGLRRSGASKAATSSFLIATPQTGVDSIAATWSLLGPAFAIVRPLAALVTALVGGMAVGRTERKSSPPAVASPSVVSEASGFCDCASIVNDEAAQDEVASSVKQRCLDALRYGFVELLQSIGGWLVMGLLIASLITVYVPADSLAVFKDCPLLSMVAVLLVAIPMYVCATGSIPIALSLMLKGLSPGTALVLLMAGPAANFASFALISKEMGRRSALVYLGAIVVGAMGFGLVIDYLLPSAWFVPPASMQMACSDCHASLFSYVCSAVLLLLLMSTRLFFMGKRAIVSTDLPTVIYVVDGMECSHCQRTVENAIRSVKGVEQVTVHLSKRQAVVMGKHTAADVVAAVRRVGFNVKEY